MGQDQRILDELRMFERLCLELAEQSRVPGEADARRQMAENYGREAAPPQQFSVRNARSPFIVSNCAA
ncbi:hypothetical protein AC629_33410 [Bradyrhizobium sp. NAS80.1]|nr:hypothetical protein AC629_33410 [Bradyrhizobium sp. NAS80.1]